MFDDLISSASEDESRVGRTTVKSKVVAVPLQNSMRLPEAPTSVITMSRTVSTSMASTSRAGLVQGTTPCNTIGIIDGSRSQDRTRNPSTSTPFERIGRLLSCRKERWQYFLIERNQQRWSEIYESIRMKEGPTNRFQVSEGKFMIRNSSRFKMTEEKREG